MLIVKLAHVLFLLLKVQKKHTLQIYIFEYVDKYIGEIESGNIILVMSDNATNNMAAVKLLKVKRLNIFCISRATHTLNLILEEIGNFQCPLFLRLIS